MSGNPSLSEDEEVVLSLAAEGESMMAMGRWEKPVLRLAELGYLRAADKFNYFVTDAGKRRWKVLESAELDAIVDWNNQIFEKRQRTIEADDASSDAAGLQ